MKILTIFNRKASFFPQMKNEEEIQSHNTIKKIVWEVCSMIIKYHAAPRQINQIISNQYTIRVCIQRPPPNTIITNEAITLMPSTPKIAMAGAPHRVVLAPTITGMTTETTIITAIVRPMYNIMMPVNPLFLIYNSLRYFFVQPRIRNLALSN